jgi:hypothetical protein
MTSYLGAYYGEHRRADAQTSCDPAGSSDTGHHRADPLLITGNKTRDAALGEPRIRAGEIIGWRFWKLCNGLLHSVFVPYVWQPGVYERSSSKFCGYNNLGYHAFRNKEQAERETSMNAYWWPLVIGSVAMWGEVIEHQYGWRSEYAGVRSLIKVAGLVPFWRKYEVLLELRERYGCSNDRTLSNESAGTNDAITGCAKGVDRGGKIETEK